MAIRAEKRSRPDQLSVFHFFQVFNSRLAPPGSRSFFLSVISIFIFFLLISPAFGQREPVLKQIDLPHPYYFREMYLPQLTTGPSSAAWLPGSQELVYSMQGTLWRQRVGSPVAQQLTDGPGYDYQPDVSGDGRWVVFTRYSSDAMELQALDLSSGKVHALTSGGQVNLEPRWSPDGSRLAFVSTAYNRHFHIFVADWKDGRIGPLVRLTGEVRSLLPRYYYSAFDHEISPTWSPDAAEIIFVSNQGHIHGSGGLWRMNARAGSPAREIYYEETTWRTHPDWSPDGNRLVYSSYLGRNWHQLWLLPVGGFVIPSSADVFPLTYGEFDRTSPRWSPNGKSIAFISNEEGNTSLWIQDVVAGARTRVDSEPSSRKYLRPTGKLEITIEDSAGNKVTPARVSVSTADGRAYAPDSAWMHADDSFDRSQRLFEVHYFHSPGRSSLTVPAGAVTIEVMKGFDYGVERRTVEVRRGETSEVSVRLRRWPVPAPAHTSWVSSDLHIHMNYAGTYRNRPAILAEQAKAENLQVVNNLIVNKEQRFPDAAYFTGKPDAASDDSTLLLHSQEFHSSYWGHLGLLNLRSNLIIPGYAGYPNTASASLAPLNATIADIAHGQGALAGYVHPFDEFPDPARQEDIHNELPVDVALGKVDYYEVLGFSDHKSSAAVWYKLLNLGFRLPAGAGTDAMADFASLRGPVGMNRVYVNLPDPNGSIAKNSDGSVNMGRLDPGIFMAALKQGRTFASNGPLITFSLGAKYPGDDLQLDPAGGGEQPYTVWMRSLVPIDHTEIVCNGKVVRELHFPARGASADAASPGDAKGIFSLSGTLPLTSPAWCLFRAYSDQAEYPVLDIYPYATTSPVYVTRVNQQSRPQGPARQTDFPDDAKYFIRWINRIIENADAHQGWNSAAEKTEAMRLLLAARKVFDDMLMSADSLGPIARRKSSKSRLDANRRSPTLKRRDRGNFSILGASQRTKS